MAEDQERDGLAGELAKLRNELEYDVMVESWEECNQLLGLLSAFEIEAVICKAKVRANNEQGFEKVPAVAVPLTNFDELRRLLTRAV